MADRVRPGDLGGEVYEARAREAAAQLVAASLNAPEDVTRALGEGIGRATQAAGDGLLRLQRVIQGATGADTQSKWSETCSEAWMAMDEALTDGARDQTLTLGQQQFWVSGFDPDHRFFADLAAVPTPQLLDRLLTHQATYRKLLDELVAKSADLNSTIDRIVGREREAVNRIVRTAEDAANQARLFMGEQREAMHGLIAVSLKAYNEWLKGIHQAIGPLVALHPVLDLVVSVVQEHSERLQWIAEMGELNLAAHNERVRELDALVEDRRNVLRLLEDIRGYVVPYRRENGVDPVTRWRDDACSALDSWTAARPGAHRTDAEEFSRSAADAVRTAWTATQTLDKTFGEKFGGIFDDPLSNETVERLVGRAIVADAIARLEATRLAEAASSAAAELQDGLDPLLADLKEQLDQAATSAPEEVREQAVVARNELVNAIRDSSLSEDMKEALETLKELSTTFGPDRIRADLSRDVLQDALD